MISENVNNLRKSGISKRSKTPKRNTPLVDWISKIPIWLENCPGIGSSLSFSVLTHWGRVTHICVDNLGLDLQGLYSATDCVDDILGRFTMILASLVQIMARIHSV